MLLVADRWKPRIKLYLTRILYYEQAEYRNRNNITGDPRSWVTWVLGHFSDLMLALKYKYAHRKVEQESHAIARKQRDAAAVRFALKLADIHYKFKSEAPTAKFQCSIDIPAQNRI